ncbi:YlbL family protein [Pseudactinotalea sp. Z1748]|uniref:YlbL family protein n=1 Tax=Pseudactinotalea sp. Z1748 TaxID=3413027 RepID=UPI003C7B9F45
MTDLNLRAEHEPRRRRRRLRWVSFTPRFVTMLISGVATFGLLGTMLVLPLPYAVQGAGPTFNTLAGHQPADQGDSNEVGDGEPTLISIEGGRAHPAAGELRLTTVVTSGGPGYPVRAANVIVGFWSSNQMVQPLEAAIDPDLTQEQRDQLAAQQMITSQEHATVAALTDVGFEVPAVLEVVDAAPGTGAEGVVAEGDLILGIQAPGEQVAHVETYADLSVPLLATPPGEEMRLLVERDGQEVTLPIITTDDGRGRSQLGIFLNADFDMPVEVSIAIDNVGGPSAGLMFALGIIDVLTPEDLTGGHSIAGTGTISLDGRVGPIGGVGLKMIGAVDDGADYFLTPVLNCSEVVGHIPTGLQVIAVDTLEQARSAVESIAAGDTDELPGCADWEHLEPA